MWEHQAASYDFVKVGFMTHLPSSPVQWFWFVQKGLKKELLLISMLLIPRCWNMKNQSVSLRKSFPKMRQTLLGRERCWILKWRWVRCSIKRHTPMPPSSKIIKGQLLESPIFRSKKLFQKGLPRLTSGCVNYNLNDSWYGLEPPDPQDDWLSFEKPFWISCGQSSAGQRPLKLNPFGSEHWWFFEWFWWPHGLNCNRVVLV